MTTKLLGAAFAVSVLATVGSLTFSGIGVVGWSGMRLFPCELCWYQRILMYPLVPILGIGLVRRGARGAVRGTAFTGLALSIPGVLIALYHSLLQHVPSLEIAQCSIGYCSGIQYRILGLTIPNLSLLGFSLVTVALAGILWTQRTPTNTD